MIKIIFGFLAIYLWLGIIFAFGVLIILRNIKNQEDYQDICQHPIALTLRWPDLLLKLILWTIIYKKLKRKAEESKINRKILISKCKDVVNDKSKNIEDRLDALEVLGGLDYYYDDEEN